MTNPEESSQEAKDFPAANSDEKIRRRLLKKHLKQRNKLVKFEKRMQNAVHRKDPTVEERAKREWDDYRQQLMDDPHSVLNYTPPSPSTPSNNGASNSRCCQLRMASRYQHVHASMRSRDERETPRVARGSQWLLEFRQKLVANLLKRQQELETSEGNAHSVVPNDDHNHPTPRSKDVQTRHAKRLKSHMERGTQQAAMFRDRLALLGYTRQKFHERAVQAFRSLDRLDPVYAAENHENDSAKQDAVDSTKDPVTGSSTEKGTTNPESDRQMVDTMWERLLATEQVVSIGCGPGCDAVGALGFFESHQRKLSKGLVLMDFAIDSWKDSVLDELIPLAAPYATIRTVVCNVRESLSSAANDQAAAILSESSGKRLVVVSYLLTETHHAWTDFFRRLLELLRGTDSLLLLTEPTAWQLHEFLTCFGTELKAHAWLDSSRDLPHLQSVDPRNGPAILLVCPS